jgi:hypothetical protein
MASIFQIMDFRGRRRVFCTKSRGVWNCANIPFLVTVNVEPQRLPWSDALSHLCSSNKDSFGKRSTATSVFDFVTRVIYMEAQ